ncbi:MAG: flavin reductase family protein [Burkholderiaceae bacterium]
MSTLSPASAYATMTQTIIPRPVAWVLTDSGEKNYNLAPFSYFNGLTNDPPMIYLSIGLSPEGGIKDTRINIERDKHFVVNIAHRELAETMTKSSATMPYGDSEVDLLGIELAPMPGSDLPRVAACRLAYACEFVELHMIKSQTIVFAELKHLYVDDSACDKDSKGRLKINAQTVDPLGRLGGGEYFTAGDVVSIDRPK